jgi:hypothetical protein
MKKYVQMGIIAIVLLVFSSCRVRSFQSIKSEDYSKYVRTTDAGGYEYSPMSYNMIKGENPYAGYAWRQVEVIDYWFNHYSDDKSLILNAYYPDADVILGFHNHYFIGTKLNE